MKKEFVLNLMTLSMKGECIAFANHKGGTGKTTSCLSIAGYLAKRGSKVLVVDFDPQANATSGIGIDRMTLKHTIYDAVLSMIKGYNGVPLSRVILKTDVENLHIAPSELDLGVTEVILQRTRRKTRILAGLLDQVRSTYDYILVDLPPSSGLLSINGLCAADHVVVPLDTGIFSFEALNNLKTSFSDVRRMTGHTIDKITMILIRYVEPDILSRILRKQNPSQEALAKLKEMFQTVFVVPESREIYEAQKKGIPISHFAPGSRCGKAYEKIVKSIVDNNKINKEIY
jgi:chromosome partitioning protein